MSARFNNELQGVLFKNIKEKAAQPDYKGSCEIAGVQYWISAWINTPKGQGTKYMSLKFKAKDMQSKSAQQTPEPYNDEIPF